MAMDVMTSAKTVQSSTANLDSTPLIPMEMDVMTPVRIVQSSIVPPDLCLMIPMVTVVRTHASIPAKALIVSLAKAVLMAHVYQVLTPVKDCLAATLASSALLEIPTALKRIFLKPAMTMVSANLLLWTAAMKSHVQKRTSPIAKPVIRARSQRPRANPMDGSVWTNPWSMEPHVAIPLAAQGLAPANRVSASATMTTHVLRMPSRYAIQETPVKSLHPPVNPMDGSV